MTMKVHDPKEIEELAREMCMLDGIGPDAIATRQIIHEKAAPGGLIRFIPDADRCFPAWHCYSHLAQLAISKR